MSQLANKVIKKDRKLHAVFVDLEKAYNKVHMEELWESLEIWCVM